MELASALHSRRDRRRRDLRLTDRFFVVGAILCTVPAATRRYADVFLRLRFRTSLRIMCVCFA